MKNFLRRRKKKPSVTLLSMKEEREHRRYLKRMPVVGILFCFGMLVISNIFLPCYADDNTVIAQIEKLDLPRNTLLSFAVRPIGWALAKGLAFLVNCLGGAIYGINSAASGLFTNPQVADLMKKVIAVATVLLALVIAYIGLQFIVKPQKISTVMTNFIVGFLLFVSLPTLVTGAYNLTEAAIGSIGANNLSSLGNQVLASNVIDTTFYDTNGFNEKLSQKNLYASNADGVRNIDPVEMVDGSEDQKIDGCVKIQNKDFWCKRVQTDSSGNKTLTNLWDGMQPGALVGSKIFSEFYYRYKIDWFNTYVTLFVTGFALILSGIKIARILFELIIKQTLAQVVGLLDIHTGQRLKQCLQSLLSSFVGLFGCMLMLQVYTIGTAAVVSKVTNPYIKIILEIAMAWMVIDGPDIFEKVFGMDVGIKHPMAAMYGMNTVAHGLKGIGKAITGNKNYSQPDENGRVHAYNTGGFIGKGGVVENAAEAAGHVAGNIAGHFDGRKAVNGMQNKNAAGSQNKGMPVGKDQPQNQDTNADNVSAAAVNDAETGTPQTDAQNPQEMVSGVYRTNTSTGTGASAGNATRTSQPQHKAAGNAASYQTPPQTTANVQNGSFTGPSNVMMHNIPPEQSTSATPYDSSTSGDTTGAADYSSGSYTQREYAAENAGNSFAQREYAAEQSGGGQADVSAHANENPEYLRKQISNTAKNSRFVRPKQAYSICYDLSKNAVIQKDISDEHQRQAWANAPYKYGKLN